MKNERVLMGKLRIAGKKPGAKEMGWLYEQAKFVYKVNAPEVYAKDYDDFSRAVITAVVKMEKSPAAKPVIDAFKKIKFKVDVLPAAGGGYFLPKCESSAEAFDAKGHGDVGAVIVWDPANSFEHSNTEDGSSTSYPPWVILAHEIGHAIQLDEAGSGAQAWMNNYGKNMNAVEMDNITRHETPIVTELGLKPRVKYC